MPEEDLPPEQRQEVTNATIALQLKYIQRDIGEIRDSLNEKYVTKTEFWPVKTIVYSGAGLVLMSVFTALVYMVIKNPK